MNASLPASPAIRRLRSHRGSAFVVTILFSTALLMLAASILGWSVSERRLNQRHALRLEARNAAEAAAEYGFAQVRYQMDNQTSFPADALDPEGAGALEAPPSSLFTGSRIDPSSVEIVGGVAQTITNDGSTTTFYVDPSDPNNQFDPMKGKRIFRRDVQILAQATAGVAGGPSVTSYIVETLAMREAPLFAHAIFYNMDLEIAPGANMTIYGPVHTNGNMWVTGQNNNSSTLDFVGPVTVTNGLYFGYEITPKMGNGSSEPTTNEPVRFANRAGSLIDLRSSAGVWRDQKMGQSTETQTTRTEFRSFASNTYNGYLQTGLHGVENYRPVAFGEYQKDTTPTDGTDQSVNTGRAIIERPLGSTETTTPSGLSGAYNSEVEGQKLARKAGLYIAVNPSSTSRTGHKPDGTTITIPAGQYRAFKADGTEVILPGATATTAGTNHPTPGGRPVIQVKTDQMTDLRRYSTFNPASSRSSSNRYDPKVIDIIEVDMTALKLAVDRTVNGASSSTIYPYDSSTTDSTYKATATTSVALSDANAISNFSASDWNGAVYIQSVDAETRRDSGVRLINGRGRAPSKATNSAEEGLTLATNDAMYVLGHFNADGTIDTNVASLTNSSRYPENSNEVPVALAADAITILSQPTFDNSGNQTGGWNDMLSAHRVSSSSWSSNWATTNPSSSNQREGLSTSIRPGATPTATSSATSGPAATTTKLAGQNTEISAALLTGIVPSNKNGSNQYSGGAHNFPRLLEAWSGALAIRGSMVALFESRVATEPWSIRVYNAPARYWGFSELFAQGRYPPQTPRVRTYRRVDFRDVTAAEYEDLVEALPW